MIREDEFAIPCAGDVCAGDTILFGESVFGGSYRKPRFLGERRIAARVVRDSYGGAKQQHTFTIEVLASDGYDPLAAGTTTTRKGRNVYRIATWRRPWTDEAARREALDEKHERAAMLRARRVSRGRWRRRSPMAGEFRFVLGQDEHGCERIVHLDSPMFVARVAEVGADGLPAYPDEDADLLSGLVYSGDGFALCEVTITTEIDPAEVAMLGALLREAGAFVAVLRGVAARAARLRCTEGRP